MSQSSSETCPDLSKDIWTDILMRLPRKPLCRLKCVSASFNHWITAFCPKPMSGIFYNYCMTFSTSRRGMKMNVLQYAPVLPPGSIRDCWYTMPKDDGDEPPLLDLDTKIARPDLSYLPSRRDTRIIDCRHGLLLCCHTENFKASGCIYFVCNPVTERWVTLPCTPHAGKVLTSTGCLAFDPREPKRYSVVQLSQICGDPGLSRVAVDVFSTETGEWVEARVVMDLCITGLAMSGKVFMNGAVHVLAKDNDGSTRLLAYHVKDGRAWTMSLPKVECGEYKREWVGESGGNMRYVISIDSTKTLVFELSDYAAGGWELKLPIHHLVMHHLSAFHPDREVYYMCCSEMEQWIIAYDPSNNNAEKFGVLLFRQDQQYFPMCWIIQPQPGWVKCFPFSPSMWDPIYDRADGLSRDPDLVLDGIRRLFSDH